MSELKRISDFEDYPDFVAAISREVLAQSTFRDFPSIVADADVCGGAARMIRTRVPVWSLERMRQLGVSEADILKSYPALRATDLVQAWAYAANHREEIERAIRENEEA
jgi:uncharacterized protein (DUF433 family)